MAQFFPDGPPAGATTWPRRIQDFYDELVAEMMANRHCRDPNLDTVLWIRARVYDALSFCQTGPEIVDSCAAALVRHYDVNKDAPPAILWEVMDTLAQSEPHTSYRTPLALEWAILNMYDVMRRKTVAEVNGGQCNPSGMGSVPKSKTAPKAAATAAASAAAATKTTKVTRVRAKPKSGQGSDMG
jgi:hypothetical protein